MINRSRLIVYFYLSITVVIGFNSAHLIETTPKLNQYKTQSMLLLLCPFIPLSCPDDSRETLIHLLCCTAHELPCRMVQDRILPHTSWHGAE